MKIDLKAVGFTANICIEPRYLLSGSIDVVIL